MTDAADRLRSLLAADATVRTFGTTDERKAAWIRHGYLLALEEVERALMDNGSAEEPRPLSRCGITVGSVYALGLDDGKCPVGMATALDDVGVTLTLYSWLNGLFDGLDTWVPYNTIKRWTSAERMSKDAALADGWCKGIARAGVFAMDPLAAFQTKWASATSPRHDAA